MNAATYNRFREICRSGVGRLTLVAVVFLTAHMPAAADEWPQFRGPCGDGHAGATDLPLRWSEKENVVWKTTVPGRGYSSPVVGEKSIWMTTATDEGRSLRAVCVDRQTGRLLHDVEVFALATPMVVSSTNSHASPTPVLDRDHVYVNFGTSGTACLDAATGKMLWKNNDLKLDHSVGPGSSPILWRDLLILTCDGKDAQYVAALDKTTGRLAWKTERSGRLPKAPSQRKSFCTPTVIEGDKRTQLIAPGPNWVFSYDPATGNELWRLGYGHLGYSVVPRPVVGHGMVYVCTGYDPPAELLAIRYDGNGDVTKTHVVWRSKKRVPLKPSLLLVGDLLYMVQDKGVATCLDAKTGEVHWNKRMSVNYAASPLFACGRVYFFSEKGKTTVVKPGKKCDVLATNSLDGRFMASAAVAGRALYLRTVKHLYRVENPAP